MNTNPISPTSALAALAAAEVATLRALNAIGGQPPATAQPGSSSEEPAPQAPPQTPPAIVTATAQAASQQGSAAPLFADLAAALASPNLPQAVAAAAQQVLALATPLDPPPSAADLKTALGQSGLLLETHLAAGQPPTADLKAALLNLQKALQTAVDAEPEAPAAPASSPEDAPAATPTQGSAPQATETAASPATAAAVATEPEPAPSSAQSAPATTAAQPPIEPDTTQPALELPAPAPATMAQAPPPQALMPPPEFAAYAPAAMQLPAAQQALAEPHAAPPPYPEGPTRAEPPAEPAVAPSAPQAVAAHRLLQDTTAALARQVMFQLASAPGAQRADDPSPLRWLFELPLATPQGTAVAQFEIDRDGGGSAQSAEGDAPAWRARFTLDLGDMGPVHAQVSLGGGRAGVSLWAENPETAQALRAGRADLADDFRADAVDADVSVFLGQPPAPAPRIGRVLDQAL